LTRCRAVFSKSSPSDERSDDEGEGEEPKMTRTEEKAAALKGEKAE